MNPSSALKRSPQALRTRSTLSKSTSLAMKACGDVAFDRTMCSAVLRRMFEKGTSWSPAARNDAMETGGAVGALTTGAAGTAGGAAAGGVGAVEVPLPVCRRGPAEPPGPAAVGPRGGPRRRAARRRG